MIAGLALSATAYGIVLAFGQSGSVAALMIGFSVLGAGVGMAETLSNDLALSSVPASKAGAASAISETAYEVGSVLGIAVLGSILNAVYTRNLQVPASLSAEQADSARQTLGGAHEVAAGLPASEASIGEQLLASASTAFDAGVVITSGIAVVLTLMTIFIISKTIRGSRLPDSTNSI